MNNNPSEEELNEDENELNDENDFEGEIVEEHLSSGERGRRRKKVKIRKRVKIKRKANPKKRVKKTFETFIWIIVVVGAAAALKRETVAHFLTRWRKSEERVPAREDCKPERET